MLAPTALFVIPTISFPIGLVCFGLVMAASPFVTSGPPRLSFGMSCFALLSLSPALYALRISVLGCLTFCLFTGALGTSLGVPGFSLLAPRLVCPFLWFVASATSFLSPARFVGRPLGGFSLPFRASGAARGAARFLVGVGSRARVLCIFSATFVVRRGVGTTSPRIGSSLALAAPRKHSAKERRETRLLGARICTLKSRRGSICRVDHDNFFVALILFGWFLVST